MFTAILSALPCVLGGAIILFALAGFWQGLGLRPHAPENRPNPHPFWWRYW